MNEPRAPRPGHRKVVLVQPSSHQSVRTLYPQNKNHAVGHKPPQSILILATYLRQHGYADTHCLDAQVEDLSPQQTADRLAEIKPDIVGFTAWTDFWYPAWKTIELTRALLPDSLIIIGGPHAAVYPQESLEGSGADLLVAGDGEDVLLEIMRCVTSGEPLEDQPGLWRKVDGKAVAPLQPLAVVKDLTRIPPPDRTLLPYKRYSSILTPTEFETTMVTSRGCPYKCVFCKMDVQKVYARKAEQVVEEFRQIEELGISDVQIYDDTFTWGNQRAIDICQGIIDSKIKVNWAIRDRVNRVTPELYRLLKQAGCYRVHFGVETGSPRILKDSGKFITMEQVEEAFRISREIDMVTVGYFMFGFIDETLEDAKMTMAFANKLAPDYASYGVLVPYPGTAIYTAGLERGIIPRDYWRDFAKNPEPDYTIPHLIEDHLDRETLVALKNEATRKFYFRPGRIVRELRNLSSFRDLRQKASLAASILFEQNHNSAPIVYSR